MRNRWYRWSFLRSLPDFAAIVVVTGKERDWLIDHGVPAGKIHLVPCGAPTDIFVPSPERQNGGVEFIMASRLSEDKGCDISIQAFAAIAPTHPDARLSIFGDGPQRAYLEQLSTDLGQQDKITFHGYVGEEELSQKMPLHDVFIQHSRIKEGSPVAIVEAMACGLPVVSTPVGGIVDQIVPEENGLLVAEGDMAGMADAMGRLAADEMLRRRFGLAGRVRAVTQYDAPRQTARLGEILMSAAKV
jgi:glycosyltransferase involved in cell wall biosynthesis